MKKVVIESPFSPSNGRSVEENINYARRCMRDSILRNEAPIASHLLYTQEGILDDNIEEERMKGIHCGFEWNKEADLVAVYVDNGITKGMKYGIQNAEKEGKKVIYRSIS